MPKVAKTFAFGRKKRSYKKPRGRYASKPSGAENDTDDVVSAETVSATEPTLLSGSEHDGISNEQESVQPQLNTSRSEKKLSSFELPSSSNLLNDRYYLIHSSFIDSLIDIIVCPRCVGSDLSISTSSDIGLACSFSVHCNTCLELVWSASTSPKCRHKQRYDINARAVLAAKECGVSLTNMQSLFNIMNIPHVMHHKTFKEISDDICNAAREAADEAMQSAVAVIKERHNSNVYASEQTSPSGLQVISVSYDGTWHKRGHSSHYGVGVAIDIDSGFVVDTHTVSNYCAGCSHAPPQTAQNYAAWHEAHKPMCNRNFDGSSNAMEMEAAKVIFGRSQATRGLIYGTMLCDGDSKALNKVNEMGCYDITVRKEDCVNHIAKRIYNQLEQVKKDNKGKLNRKLTAAKIKKITNTYATNLRASAPDVEKMKLGVMGGLFHMMSTDSKPNHRLCPEGETSWCKYNRALAIGEEPPGHNPTLTPDIGTYVFPIIKRLTESDLLTRCAKMTTQNPNECFNSTIWKRCPKVTFAHLPTVETAVALSVLSFNMGPVGLYKVFEKLGLSWTSYNSSFALHTASTRIRHSKRKGKKDSQWKRKHLVSQRLQERDRIEDREGVTYSSGAFNC